MTAGSSRIRRDEKADQEAEARAKEAGLPGRLSLRKIGRTATAVSLDLPNLADQIPPELLPAVRALAQGFAVRYSRSLKSQKDVTIAVAADYVSADVRNDDLDHFIAALSAVVALKVSQAKRPTTRA